MKKRKKKTKTHGHQSKEGFTTAKFETPGIPDYVVVELKYEAPLAFTVAGFAAPEAIRPKADALNSALAKYDIATVRSHFGLNQKAVHSRVEVAMALPAAPAVARFENKGMDAQFIQSGFVQVVPKRSQDAMKIAKDLKRHDSVWNAFVAPRPVPAVEGSAVGSRNFEPAQGYLYAPPDGIGAAEVWAQKGGTGKGITICDIEGDWNRKHEDLPSGIKLLGGTVLNDIEWRNHGTAVLGEMVSLRNGKGTIGICHDASAVVHSAFVNGVLNAAGAIATATNALKAGDVILIELQGTGPNGKYVAMQYWDDVFSAIKVATAKGITVVEAAGNGEENFDLPVFNNTGLQKDSGAIVVGAGIPPSNYMDFDGFGAGWPPYSYIGVPRSRIWFSDYGAILSVQGWGWHVTTLGYGDAQGGALENKWYTLRFSGTSSASPIVAGAVASLQGMAIAKNGIPLTPGVVRDILIRTGTPQVDGPNAPITQKIGPLPNLPMAMKKI